VDGGIDIAPRRRRLPWPNAVLFLATVATTVLSGAAFAGWAGGGARSLVLAGLSYATAVLAILLAHEMGHWLLARAWGVDSTLPYFIPIYVPGSMNFGTLGALIRLRSPIPSRDAVLDIGAAGPIAGALVAIPVYAWGLAHSEVRAVGELAATNTGSPFEMIMAFLRGETLTWGGDAVVFGDSLLTAGIQRLVLGPLPPGHDVVIHPVALAAWLGLFVTTLNLIPLGQLDGGHVTYAWLGERGALRVSRLVSAGLLLAGIFVSMNWLVWWLLTRIVIGLRHPPAIDDAPIGPARRVVALASLALFVLTFVPVPFRL
jgi:membrane-associated protease RseP (regulator of RpoE activity)